LVHCHCGKGNCRPRRCSTDTRGRSNADGRIVDNVLTTILSARMQSSIDRAHAFGNFEEVIHEETVAGVSGGFDLHIGLSERLGGGWVPSYVDDAPGDIFLLESHGHLVSCL